MRSSIATSDSNLGAGRGAKTAISYEGQTYSYAEIAAQANQVGNGLRGLGVEIEQRVALALLDSPAFAAAFFGAMKIGAAPVPMNTLSRAADCVYMLNDSRAKVLFIHASLWAGIQGIMPELTHLRHVIVVGLERQAAAEAPAKRGFLTRRAPTLAQPQTIATATGRATALGAQVWANVWSPW